MSRVYYVYGLRIKGTDEIRYVGVSCQPRRRLKTHRSGRSAWGDERLAKWIAENDIEMVILEESVGRGAGRQNEEKWIRTCKALGFDLLNERAGAQHIMTKAERVQYTIEWLDRHDISPTEACRRLDEANFHT